MDHLIPVFIAFFAWGIKPGPGTILMSAKTLAEGPVSGITLALGNNFSHILIFAGVVGFFRAFYEYNMFYILLQLSGSIYITVFGLRALYQSIHFSVDAIQSIQFDKKRMLANLLSGMWVGLMNPLNVSFYLGIVPEFVVLQDLSLIEFSLTGLIIIFMLLGGQIFYIISTGLLRQITAHNHTLKIINFLSGAIFTIIGAIAIYSHGSAIIQFSDSF